MDVFSLKSPGKHKKGQPLTLMKWARMGAFRGAWGDRSPHKQRGCGGIGPPTKNFTQTHKKPRQTQKGQASHPHEMRPNGRISGGVGGLVPPQKTSPKPTKSPGKHKEAKPLTLMKCARMGAFRGAWGDWSPHKKLHPNPQKAQANTKRPSLSPS